MISELQKRPYMYSDVQKVVLKWGHTSQMSEVNEVHFIINHRNLLLLFRSVAMVLTFNFTKIISL